MAGQIFGTAKASYLQANRGETMDVGSGIFLDKQTGLLVYETKNGTFVGEGISFLTPVKEEWVIGVARAKIPLIGYVRLLPNIIFDEIKKLVS
jgi:signal peptidase